MTDAEDLASAVRIGEVLRIIMNIAATADIVVGQVLTEFQVSASAAGVLWAIAPDTEPPTMREIAARLGCDPSTISLTADKLEDSGLVRRLPHPTDGRKRTLALTEAGRRLWDAIGARLQSSGVLGGLNTDDLRALYNLLIKVRPAPGIQPSWG